MKKKLLRLISEQTKVIKSQFVQLDLIILMKQ